MKRTPVLLTIGIIILAIGAYVAYDKFLRNESISLWSLVPSNTVAVYEASSCKDCVDAVKKSSVWEVIRLASSYGHKQDTIRNLMNLLMEPRPGSLVSMHVTAKDNFDFVYYASFANENEKQLFANAVDMLKSVKGLNVTDRVYNEEKIFELSTKDNIFSWVVLDKVWVGSYTPFLIEDVLRTYKNGEESSFKNKLTDVFSLPRIKNDAGNLYLHLPALTEWISVFMPSFKDQALALGTAAMLDVKTDEMNVVLNGFSMESTAASLLSVFSDQSPTSFDLKSYVSKQTILMAGYGISNGDKFGKRLNNLSGKRAAPRDSLDIIAKSVDVNLSALYSSVADEIGVCHLEPHGTESSKVLIIETNAPEEWMDALNAVTEKMSKDTIFYEPFSNYEIRELALYRFPEKMFWPFVSGFDQSYYTRVNNAIIIGDDLERLKSFLMDIDNEETWGKSVDRNQFLSSTLLESNISFYVNTPLAWSSISEQVNPKWKSFIVDNYALLQALGMGAVQFSHLNESFYTNIAWRYSDQPAKEESPTASNRRTITSFNSKIISRPFVVRSHVDKSLEVFVQDSLYQVSLLGADGKVQWSKSLEEPIVGNVYQVDYYANGKLQYFFATKSKLHIIDRLGNYVPLFPVVHDAVLDKVSLVDYDNSKKYRFMVSDNLGNIWMFDKEGVNLEGWQPKNVEGDLFSAAAHHRIRGKDYILAITRDGKAHLMNRRGETLKGFPLDLDARPLKDYHLETGNSTATTGFVVVSRDGFKIKFNLEGKIVSRETLIKTSVDSRFSLVNEANGKSYIVVRQDPKRLTLIGADGKEILSNDFVGINEADVQFYDFGAGKVFYVVTDLTQDLSFVYNAKGQLLTSPPIESNYLKLSPGKMFSVFGESVVIQSF